MDPYALTIFGYNIRWYSICLLVAFFISFLVISKEGKRFNVNKDFIFNMLFWTLIFGIVGARLYYVIFNFSEFSSDSIEILKVWNGGLAIHGGIIAGLLTLVLYTKKYKVRLVRYTDFLIVGLSIAQSIGRWGNFFNQEAYGWATSLEHLNNLHIPKFIIDGMKIGNVYYTPTFLYESIACFILFIMLCILRRTKYIKIGSLTAYYLIGYGIIRFIIERYRTDSLMLGGLKVAMIVSVFMVIIGTIILFVNKKKGKFEDLYNDKTNIESIQF